ncbi:MAG: 5-dehydro-2-deoxygluconokinase [Hyphomicrobiales bacterium]|nr:5-dehydro-2-deoxygluconokinase [Hyphomicrobiales bacterium]MCY4048410.1 5-dehydro-2-deoxygluconokinase [Hyphomicrobiales bacterium]
MSASDPLLDVICIGRSSVDLYGKQVGGRLEDMSSFNKYIGGSPTNISIGCARLGLKSALVTRVGNEAMGRFISETLSREGVDTSFVITDPERLTALVLLGIRSENQFPLIFYRENCADMALCKEDMDAGFIASARAVLVTGTHFSTRQVAEASFEAIALAKKAKRKVAFDIDYRPNLWALGGHDDGESRFAESARVSSHLREILPHCDLIVGTEEEWKIAGGNTDTISAIKSARQVTDAVIVCKRGAQGCIVFDGDVTGWQDGISTPVREIEVFNVLGAGDGFMSGFLSGWLRGEPLSECARYANICGALAVSRHGCAPAYPSQRELRHMIETGSRHFALRKDAKLEQIHHATTRRKRYDSLAAFAFDHRKQFLEIAEKHGRDAEAVGRFKQIALEAVASMEEGNLGILVDDSLGRDALHAASEHDIWIGRPIEQSGIFPLALEEGPDLGSRLAEWPANHCVKVLAPLRLDDSEQIIRHHEETLMRLADACRNTGHEFLLEIINGRQDGKPADPEQILALLERLYEIGIYPDWWKLEPVNDAAFWQKAGTITRMHDPDIQGIIVLGKAMASEHLYDVFKAARSEETVRGFAIGRTIFNTPAEEWCAGGIDDGAAKQMMADNFRALIAAWHRAGGT